MEPERWKKVKEMYEAVLEHKAGNAKAFLARACAGDPTLRQEVEELLAYRQPAESFIESTALDIAAKTLASDTAPATIRIGEALSQYRILEKAGAGGMGVLYKALDIKLDRHVALKFLPEQFAADRQALERFQREARAIAALDHPNICTIHSIAEDSGRPFIVMQWLDGETLEQRIGGRPLAIDDVVNLGIQITDALEKVHAKSIIHRDIKPANIIVTREGQAKILDFGIAKIRESRQVAGDRDARGLTDAGTVVGTVGYMSPEQVLGRQFDSRADLFSWGAVLYEMATGTKAFGDDTAGTIYDQILHRTPPLPSTLNPLVPPGLDRIIEKALEKAPERRYQSASEMRSDLAGLGERSGAAKRFALSGNRPNTRWLLAIAASLLGLAGLVWWGTRGNGMNFEALDTVMLGNIQDSTADTVLNGTIGNALRIALEQSRYVDVLPEGRVSAALLRMKKSEDAVASDEVAREVCQAEGAKILIGGSIARASGEYELSVRLVDCATGHIGRTLTESVASRAQILSAVDSIANNLRLELGESARSVAESHVKLDQATTSSLEALKFFTDGNALFSKGRYDDARVLFHRALELDPEFARAYASLGFSYAARDALEDSRQGEHYFQEALKRLDRVTERERLEIQALYHASLGDERKALSFNRLLADAYPKVYAYRANIAGSLRRLRQYADAIREYEQAFRLDPNSSNVLINIAVCYTELQQLDQATSYYDKAFALAPDREADLIFNHQYGWLQVLSGREERARAVFDKMLAKSAVQKARGYRSFGILALYRGRFAEARRQLEEASRLNELNAGFDSAARDLLHLGEALLLVGQTRAGLQQLDRAIALAKKGPAEAWILSWLSVTNSRAGRTSLAENLLALLKMKARPGNASDTARILHAEAELALAQHATEESVEKLRRARTSNDYIATELSLALGLTRTGHKEEAIELYESVVAKPVPSESRTVEWVIAHRDLARLYEASGQTAKARTMYLKMLELWAGADPGILPVEEVRRALKRLEG